MVDLDHLCERLGITVKQLSIEVGLAASSIYKWKMRKDEGGAYPSYEVSRKLLELGATPEEIFGVDCAVKCPNAGTVRTPSSASVEELLRRIEALERDRPDRSKAVG